MKGRKKLPIELAKLKGANKKNPGRYKTTPPKSKFGIGDPPKGMLKEAVQVWKEVVQNAPAGVLTASERHTLEILSNLMAEYRNPDSEGFPTSKLGLLHKMLGDLAMNPIERQRLNVAEVPKSSDKKKDDVEDFSAFRRS